MPSRVVPAFGGSPPATPLAKQKEASTVVVDGHQQQQPPREEPPAEVLAPLAPRAGLPAGVGDAPGFNIFSFLKDAAGELCVDS